MFCAIFHLLKLRKNAEAILERSNHGSRLAWLVQPKAWMPFFRPHKTEETGRAYRGSKGHVVQYLKRFSKDEDQNPIVALAVFF